MKTFKVHVPTLNDVKKLGKKAGEKLGSLIPTKKVAETAGKLSKAREEVVKEIQEQIQKGGAKVKNIHLKNAVLTSVGHFLSNLGHKMAKDKPTIPTKEEPVNTIDYWVPIVGVTFNGRQEIIKELKGTEKLTMIWEKTSDYPNAIGIYAADKKVGHLPDKHGEGKVSIAKMIRDKVRANKTVTIIGWEKVGGTENHPKVGIRLHLRNPR